MTLLVATASTASRTLKAAQPAHHVMAKVRDGERIDLKHNRMSKVQIQNENVREAMEVNGGRLNYYMSRNRIKDRR